MGHPWSHRTHKVICQNTNPNTVQSSPARMQSFSVSAWPKGSKPTDRAKLPGLIMLGIANHYPTKQPGCPARAGSQAERKQGLLSTFSSHPSLESEEGSAAWLEAGNITPGHNVCCWAMETCAMDSQCHQPSFTKQTAVKKGFHWHRHHPYAHSSSDYRVRVNSGMLICLGGGLFGGVFASWIYLINFFDCPWILAHHWGTEKYNMTTNSLWYLLST